jgi:hypothetical protein
MSIEHYIYMIVRNCRGRLEIKRCRWSHNYYIDLRGAAKLFIELLEQLLAEKDFFLNDLPNLATSTDNSEQKKLYQLLHRWMTYRDEGYDLKALSGDLVKDVGTGIWSYECSSEGHGEEITVKSSIALLGPIETEESGTSDKSDYILYDEYGKKLGMDEWLERARY